MPTPSQLRLARRLLALAALALTSLPALAKSSGCTAVPIDFPPAGATLAAGASQTIPTFAAGEVITFTQISGPFGTIATQGDGTTIAGPFGGDGTYLASPITTSGTASVTVKNLGSGAVTLSAVCNAPSTFTVTVTTDPAIGTASNCTAGSTSNPSCSLRDAIAAVNALSGAAGTIYFSPAVIGTITLMHGYLQMNANTVANIVGPGANILAISGNNASSILQTAATISISGLTFTAGKTTGTGGAIQSIGNLSVSACAFTANQATIGGGAISTEGPFTVTSSSFYGNSGGLGGAIYTNGSSVTINNSTFTGNTASSNGGAINIGGAAVQLTNTTIAGNQAITGGGYYAAGGSLTLANTAIAGNTSTGICADLDPGAALTDNGGNYYNTSITGGASPLNPMLLPLANYGGPVETMLPEPLSPLLCQGTATNATAAGLLLDARNNPRTTVYGSTTCVDIGADESNYALSFVQQPTTTIAGLSITPAPTVQWKESSIALASAAQPIQIAAASGSLSGTTTQSTSASGLSTFSGLSINTVQTADTLKATLPLSTTPSISVTTTSSAFNIVTPVTAFTITALPSTATAGSAVGFTVTALNGSAVATYYTGTITISSAQDTLLAFVGGSVMYTFTAADAGVHTFTITNGAVFKTAGADTLTVTDTGNNVAATSGTITVSAATPALLSAVSGSGQSAPIGGTFTAPLIAKVTDLYGNPNSGVTVTFAGPATGTGTAPVASTAVTGANGTASLTVIANATASVTPYTVAASVTGISTPATFTLTNAQAASRISVVQVAPQPVSGGTGVSVPTTFVATLSDATQNSAGSPTGTVQFYMGSTALGAPVPIVNALATLTTTFSTAGGYSISAQYLGDSNFTGSVSTLLVEVVSVPGYTLSMNPSSLTISRGTPASVTLVITPVGNYQGTLTYACGGLPAFTSCIFSPVSVAINGNNLVQNVPLTIYTLGPNDYTSSLRTGTGTTVAAGLLWLPALVFAGLLALRRKKLARIHTLLMLLLFAGGLLGLGGCGETHFLTPVGTDSVTINAIGTATPGTGSANLNQTVTLPVTIQ